MHEMKLRFAIESGFYFATFQEGQNTIAFIVKGQKCLVKLVNGVIDDIEPNLDRFDLNIIRTIITTNLGYAAP
jgi:hypothetical protein